MNYSIEQLPNQRWGIYLENRLLASVGNRQIALKNINLLRKINYPQPKFGKNKKLAKSKVMAA